MPVKATFWPLARSSLQFFIPGREVLVRVNIQNGDFMYSRTPSVSAMQPTMAVLPGTALGAADGDDFTLDLHDLRLPFGFGLILAVGIRRCNRRTRFCDFII